jgi:RNA polymerase sigma factor (sigma-70 family)
MAIKGDKKPFGIHVIMGINDNTNSVKSSQILPFKVEKLGSQLSINIDDTDIKLLYIKYYSMVYKCCQRILCNNENAKDMVQNVFAHLLELKTKGKLNIEFPAALLSTVAKNMSKNNIKKTRRELIQLYDIATTKSFDWYNNMEKNEQEAWEAGIIDNGYEKVEAKIIVKAILAEQNDTIRKIYFYRYYDCMTYEQIGEVIGFSKSEVSNKIKFLEKQVRTFLEKGKK